MGNRRVAFEGEAREMPTSMVQKAPLSQDKENCYERDLTRVVREVNGRSRAEKKAKRMAAVEKAARKKSLTKQRGAARDFKAWESEQSPSDDCANLSTEDLAKATTQQQGDEESVTQKHVATCNEACSEVPPTNPWSKGGDANGCTSQVSDWVIVDSDVDSDAEEQSASASAPTQSSALA